MGRATPDLNDTIFYRIARAAQRKPLLILVVTGAVTVFLGYFALRIRLSPDIYANVPRAAEAPPYAQDAAQPIAPEYIVLAVESPDPLRAEALQALSDALEAIEQIPHVRGGINPFNFVVFATEGRRVTPTTQGPGGRAPVTPEDVEVFRQRITTDPLARNMVISEDNTTLFSIIAMDSLEDYGTVLGPLRRILQGLETYYTVRIAGSPPLIEVSQQYLWRDVPILLGGAILVVLAVFFFGFGSKRGFLLPFLVVGLGTLWTIGIMSLVGLHLTLVTLMVPPLVLILGSSYSTHVLTQYYRDLEQDAPSHDWIPLSVARIVQTVFLAAGTTVFGFLGLLIADIRQIREFGLSASIGIVLCALLALFFFPPVLSMLKTPPRKLRERVESGPVPRLMRGVGMWVLRWRYVVLGVFALIVAGFALTIRRVQYNTNYMSYFRAREPSVVDSQWVIAKLGGYLQVRVTLQAPGGQAGYFLDPVVLARVAALEDELAKSPDVTYITSFTSYLRAYNRAVAGSHTIPSSRAPVLALSRLFRAATNTAGGKELVGELADDIFSRLTLVVRVWDSKRQNLMYEARMRTFAAETRALAERMVGAGHNPVVWGATMRAVEVSERLARDQITSTIISTALILILCSFSFRSLRYGLYTVLSTAAGICLNFLIMALLSIPLDIVTVMFTSVSMGVGVDSSIHVIIQYRRRRKAGEDPSTILSDSLAVAGQPILLTVVSLVTGLLVLLASSFTPIGRFGILVSLAIVTTSAGSLVLLPAVLAVELKWSLRRAQRSTTRPQSAS